MNPSEKHEDSQHILYDAEQLGNIGADLFEPGLLEQKKMLRGCAHGRGTTHFFELNGREFVLRHYHRGGRAADVLGDRYLITSLAKTRAWREWYLLKKLIELDLPVPRPVAARVVTGRLFYRADLITLRIEKSQPLSQRLRFGSLGEKQWCAIGACIGRFHHRGIYHADLNAHNILLDAEGSIYLVDFDKGAIRNPRPGWQQANLARLLRSLQKLSRQHATFHFNGDNWHTLLGGWRG